MSKALVISFRYSYFREDEVRCPLKIIKSIEMYLFKQFFFFWPSYIQNLHNIM